MPLHGSERGGDSPASRGTGALRRRAIRHPSPRGGQVLAPAVLMLLACGSPSAPPAVPPPSPTSPVVPQPPAPLPSKLACEQTQSRGCYVLVPAGIARLGAQATDPA